MNKILKNIIFFFLVLTTFVSKAQFGNEWIDFSQDYYKFKIVEDGFYKITEEQLRAAGFPTSSIPASRIQMFRLGKEMAIEVKANANGTVNYIQFYATKNDGKPNAALYNTGEQPHQYHNLFSDSASYFITYKLVSGNNKRMKFSSDINSSGLTPQETHFVHDLKVFSNRYASGYKFSEKDGLTLVSYSKGEGWTGDRLGKNSTKEFTFNLKDRKIGSRPQLEVVVVGENRLSHQVIVQAGKDESSLAEMAKISFDGYDSRTKTFPLPESSISSGGILKIKIIAQGIAGQAESISIASLKLIYEQNLSLDAENKQLIIPKKSTEKAYVQVSSTAPDSFKFYDINDFWNQKRLASSNFTSRVDVVIPNISGDHSIYAVNIPKSIDNINKINLSNPQGFQNYLIISTKELRTGETDFVEEYRKYRASKEGGSFDVQVMDIDDLYNLFGYGDYTPQAIRRYILLKNKNNGLANVFIIGKGFTINYNKFRINDGKTYIPTFGYPGGDGLFSARNITGNGAIVGDVPIGRLNATKPFHIQNYLEKVKEMEALPFDKLFRKNVLQLSGGRSVGEKTSFRNAIFGFKDLLTKDFLGGKTYDISKLTSDDVEYINVTERVNKGVGFINFFGHSSGTVGDIEIGRVSNNDYGFKNEGKYPVFLINGCQAGDLYSDVNTFGEDWLMAKKKLGGVIFIAHASSAISSSLKKWSNTYIQNSFGDDEFIGRTIGAAIVRANKKYLQTYGNNEYSYSQIHGIVLQGDPAYKLFGAKAPDYATADELITAKGYTSNQILTNQDSFKIEIIVKNYGRTVKKPLEILVERTLSDGTKIPYKQNFSNVLYQDTLTFNIPNKDESKDFSGLNNFKITLNSESKITELNEANNTANLQINLFKGGTFHIFPEEYSVLDENKVKFVFQSSNSLEKERGYELEIDTSPEFNSPKKQAHNLTGKVLINKNLDLSTFLDSDTVSLFWRTKFSNKKENESNDWVVSSFTIAKGSNKGWGQFDINQIKESEVTGVTYNQTDGKWQFDLKKLLVELFTYGGDNTFYQYEDLKLIIENGDNLFITDNGLDPFCKDKRLNALVFDKDSGVPYIPIQTTQIDEFNDEVCGRIPQQIYNFSEAALTGTGRRLQFLVDNMENGDKILLFSIGKVKYSAWDEPIFETLKQLGVSKASLIGLADGQPLVMVGEKGMAVGLAKVIKGDDSSTPVTEQTISFKDNFITKKSTGKIVSKRIGPAKEWKKFAYKITEDADDNATFEVYGINKSGQKKKIGTNARTKIIDVSSLNAKEYPYLGIDFDFSDFASKTPAQIKHWQVSFSSLPEGILFSKKDEFIKVNEGQEIAKEWYFSNISNENFTDSLTVLFTVINQNEGKKSIQSFKVAPPKAKDTLQIKTLVKTTGIVGNNNLKLEIKPNENERFLFNNKLVLVDALEVVSDESNPTLDVTFDGYHILNGDIVSPNPNILVTMRDDNEFIFKTDTIGVSLEHKKPGETAIFQKVSFSDSRLEWTPASKEEDFVMNFKPGALEDGVHTLRVQARDYAGNTTGDKPYEIDFEVVNESSITNFYPYPNPFSTSCRFIFTLTGSTIPSKIKIQIMTVKGRVVREITQDEIGPIRVGNNITQYVWDGRDEFGDELANGVYFYKVFLDNTAEMKNRKTAGDKAFKNGFGKLYILR